MKVYFISGLAADRRVFRNIRLPEGYKTIYLDWITHHPHESLESYASRLAQKIDTTDKFVLVGLSMGGMIASEIAKFYQPQLTILISSVPVYHHFPRRFRLAKMLNMHRVIPVSMFKSASVIKRLFAPESREDKQVLLQLVRESDPAFIKWALGAILHWKNESVPVPMAHIHGSKDEILPVKYTSPTHIINRGTHLMVMNRASEINRLLAELLNSVQAKML